MEIVWDEPKRLANMAKHGFDFADLDADFFLWAVVREARKGRYKAIGRLGDKLVAVILTPLGSEAISVISMRPANIAERRMTDD